MCPYLHAHTYMTVKWRSNRSDRRLPSGSVSQPASHSHRTMGLFLWCNWSIRQNKGRACCSACASSIMHKRCTDRKLLVKHDTCKSPALSLIWHSSARGRHVASAVPEAFWVCYDCSQDCSAWFDPTGCCSESELWGQGNVWNGTVNFMLARQLMAKPHRKKLRY